MKTLFVGDAHLGSWPDTERLQSLLELLDTVETGDNLVLLGDIFDFWFEWPGLIQAGHAPLLCKLKEISGRASVFFVPGNHDLWAGPLLERFGPKVVSKGFEMQLSGKRVWVEHGDMIGKQNRVARAIMGNKLAIWAYKKLHPQFGIGLASWVSALSRKKSSWTDIGGLPDWLFDGLPKGVRAAVVGHFHLPAMLRKNRVVLMCVGDWMHHFTYGLHQGQELLLLNKKGQVLDREVL